jgi:hypothetical protein
MVLQCTGQQDMEFGGKEDIRFARALWKNMQDYQNWKLNSQFYPGTSPHGKVLRMYYNLVNVNGEP